MENKVVSVEPNTDIGGEVKKTDKTAFIDRNGDEANLTVHKSIEADEKSNHVQKKIIDSIATDKKVDEVEKTNIDSVLIDEIGDKVQKTVNTTIEADETKNNVKNTIDDLVVANGKEVEVEKIVHETVGVDETMEKVEKTNETVAADTKENKLENSVDQSTVADEVRDEVEKTEDDLVTEDDDKKAVESVDEKENDVNEMTEGNENIEEESFSDLEDDGFEFGEPKEEQKPSKDEYAVAKWLKANVPTKKTKFLNHHVEYFTGSKAVDALLASKFANGKNPLFLTRLEVTDFLHTMLVHKLFHRAKKVPVSEQELKGKSKKKDVEKSKSGDEKEGEKSSTEGKEKDTKESKEKEKEKEKEKKKRKIRLEMHLEQIFLDSTDAYVWIYDPMPWYYWVCGALVVFGTIGVCMFPLWPATVRKGVYYLSIAAAGFLVMIIVLAILRVVVFCLVWALTLARHHLWLLPNLTEDVGFFASFWPLYQYEYRGPGSESDKAAKNKKKRKKDKLSDDEGDDKTPLIQEEEQKASEVISVSAPEKLSDDNKDNPTPPPEVQTESESENSQRSSTDRDFEMVDPEDVDAAEDPSTEPSDKQPAT